MVTPRRLALIVSHPIQYYVPLYRRLSARSEVVVKVFFTWHSGDRQVVDPGFRRPVAWDLPLVDGYDFEAIPNVAASQGTHGFFGLRNPSLVERVLDWGAHAVHFTGWGWWLHLLAIRAFHRAHIPILFRGDSHLLDPRTNWLRWWVKRAILRRVFSWPSAFLFVGSANRAYFEAFGVTDDRLFYCPHSIDVSRFGGTKQNFDQEAAEWRRALEIEDSECVLLYAGKFERKKQPVELMKTIRTLGSRGVVLIMAGDGEYRAVVEQIASESPSQFRLLPFQNQSRMPIVYRLGSLFTLPSLYGETWGLAVNEALACGTPALVSDRVGCAADVIQPNCGGIFPATDLASLAQMVNSLSSDPRRLRGMRAAAAARAKDFDIGHTDSKLIDCLNAVLEDFH